MLKFRDLLEKAPQMRKTPEDLLTKALEKALKKAGFMVTKKGNGYQANFFDDDLDFVGQNTNFTINIKAKKGR